MKAILDACKIGRIPAEPALVIAPKEDLPAVQIARDMNVEVAIINPSQPHFAQELLCLLQAEKVDLLCLAGFMRLLPAEVVQNMPNRILNIHPALLPKFGGKGMYGMRVHEAVLQAGEKESGCTVHYVNERYDEGEILLQKKCPVLPDDTPQTLAARILPLEHECYVEAIKLWIQKNTK
ncbi:MAG: phosphoribosylglycinamide formyltransferase [Candidatus Caldarchaeum sp.]